jgi:tetratricopeptide (TPR) repeat protein
MENEFINEKILKAINFFHKNNYFEAKKILYEVLKSEQFNTKANEILAYILGNEGDSKAAIEKLDIACSQKNASAEAHYWYGVKQLEKTEFEKAIESFKKSLQKFGDFFEGLNNLGTAYSRIGKMNEALSCYEKCIKIKHDSHEVFFNIGRVYDELKDHKKALENYTHAIKLKDDFIEAWDAKGVTLFDLKFYEESLKYFNQANLINPYYAETWFNRANSLRCLQRYSEALDGYNKAISLNDKYVDAWLNKGAILKELRNHNEALVCFKKCIELNSDCAEAYFNISLIKLLEGNYDDGWNLYEYRWLRKGVKKRFTNINELKTLKNIAGKKILVWHEQGLGDTIQFSRFINELIKLNADVTFEVQDQLLSFFHQQIECSVKTNIKDNVYDFQIPLLSLPRLFNIKNDNVPPPSIKFNFDSLKSDKNNGIKLKIGLACSGNPKHENDHNRSIPLKMFKPILDIGQCYLIQKEVSENDKKFLEKEKIIFLGSRINDFKDTANFINEMDLVVSVDTSLIHLAGSLQKNSLLLLPWVNDWRWMLNRDTSPWYPTINLIRQKTSGDWSPVIKEVQEILNQKLLASE